MSKLTTFKALDKFLSFVAEQGWDELDIQRLSTDIEDPGSHYYVGEDLQHFKDTGGDLLPGNGYFYNVPSVVFKGVEEDESYGEYNVLS